MKEAIVGKKDVHQEICKSRTEAKKAWDKNMKNRAKKVVTKAMKEVAEQEVRELIEHPNKVFKNGKDVEGGRCMRGSDARRISREIPARAHVKNYE